MFGVGFLYVKHCHAVSLIPHQTRPLELFVRPTHLCPYSAPLSTIQQVPSSSTNHVFWGGRSIIGVTSVRIKFMLELDIDDATYGISSITLLSALVLLLGFINANLPVLPPC